MKEIRLAGKIVNTLIKDRMSYTSRLIADTFVVIARFGILLLLYFYVFKIKGGEIDGYSFEVVAWSMFFYFSFSTLYIRYVAKTIMQDVQSGSIEAILSKPISYLWYRSWWQLGSGLYPFLVITFAGALGLFVFVGLPDTMTDLFFFATVLVCFFLAIILSLALYLIIGVLSFWVEDINPIFWIVDKSVMILGGSYLPVALFPKIMYEIAIWSPFGATQFLTHTVYESWSSDWQKLLLIQIFWIIVLFLILFILFKKARKKVSVNGG